MVYAAGVFAVEGDMPRKLYVPNSEYIHHVWGRSVNREWFGLPMEDTWSIFSNYLYLLKFGFEFQIYSFVLMSNHYHALFRTPLANLPDGMEYFQREVSKEIGRFAGRINQIFGAPYGKSVLMTDCYYQNAYKYIYRNPVEAGIVRRSEDYQYSTLHGLLGRSRLLIPLEEDFTLFGDVEGTLNWINTDYPSLEVKETIKFSMRKSQFKFPREWRVDEVF